MVSLVKDISLSEDLKRKLECLFQMDKELCESVSKIVKHVTVPRFAFSFLGEVLQNKEWEHLEKSVLLAGSNAERTAFCRFINTDDAYMELDVMFVIMTFCDVEEHRSLLETVTEAPGFYNIYNWHDIGDKCCTKCVKLKAFFRKHRQNADTCQYLSSDHMKGMVITENEEYQSRFEMLGKDGSLVQIHTEKYMKEQTDFQNIEIKSDSIKVKGPSVKVGFRFLQNGEAFFRWSGDRVVAIHLQFWPQEVDEWFNRKRRWPDETIVFEIKQAGCHLVCKGKIAWRISFSLAEMIIAEQRTYDMKLCHFVAKLIYYRYIRSEQTDDGIHLSSYVLKTMFLWETEIRPQAYWAIENIHNVLCGIFEQLSKHLKDHTLRNYFLPSMNLLRDKPYHLTSKTADVAWKISKEPEHYLSNILTILNMEVIKKKLNIVQNLATISENDRNISKQ